MTQLNEFWDEFSAREKGVKLGGIKARKPGYHNERRLLSSSDYSVIQFAIDRQGPDNEASAIDLTFPDAQRGDYKTIKKYSRRLMQAGLDNDPRTKYFREFFGNNDDDDDVEGYDFSRDRYSTSDSSHLWHIHISWHRRYINDPAAREALLSIMWGETYAEYVKRTGAMEVVGNTRPAPTDRPSKPSAFPEFPGVDMRLSKPSYNPDLAKWQARMAQRGWSIEADGYFGPKTLAVVKEFQAEKNLGVSGIIGAKTWAAAWTAPITNPSDKKDVTK